METRQTKNSRPQLSTVELEVLQERFEEQQTVFARQKEAFASEREKFNQEKTRILTEREEEQERSAKELEASHHTINELRDEVRRREDELRKWGENETQNAIDYEGREEIFRELEKLRKEMNGLRMDNATPVSYGRSGKVPIFEPTAGLFTPGENFFENTGPKLTFREALETVPYFDGYNMSISAFARACRRAREVMPVSSEGNLTRLLINRLRGRAQAAVEDEPCDNITQFIDLLTSAFGSQKTINQYRGELSIIHIRKGEHILDYVSRVKDLRSAIIDSERRERGQLTNGQLADINALTARSFCEGLPLEFRLQFQPACYNQPFEAFSTAKTIARRLELDKARFEGPSKAQQWTELYPLNPIGPPRAQSTPHRSPPLRDRYDHRDRYNAGTNNRSMRPFNQRYHGPPEPYRESLNPDPSRDRPYTRERSNYRNQEIFETPREQYYQRNYDAPRNRPAIDRRTPDPPSHNSYGNAYRREEDPGTNARNDRRGTEKWCRYCKTDGHEIEDCRKRQYNNNQLRRENPGNAVDPSGWRDAPRGDQARQMRPVNATEANAAIPSGSQS